MGQLLYYLPFTWIIMLIGSLSLCGFPLLSGYFSKDCLLETAYSSSNFGLFIFILAIIAAFLTSFYSFRSLYLVFFGSYFPGVKNSTQYFSDASILMKISMMILTIFSLIFGALFIEIFTSVTGLFVYKNTITFPIYASLIEYEYIQLMIKLFPTIICFLGMFLGWRIFSKERYYNISLNYYAFFNLTNQQFFFNSFYNIIAKKALNIGYFQYKIIDRGLLEYFGPYGLTNLINWLIFKTTKLYSGYILHYILIIILILLSNIIYDNITILLILGLSLIIYKEH